MVNQGSKLNEILFVVFSLLNTVKSLDEHILLNEKKKKIRLEIWKQKDTKSMQLSVNIYLVGTNLRMSTEPLK